MHHEAAKIEVQPAASLEQVISQISFVLAMSFSAFAVRSDHPSRTSLSIWGEIHQASSDHRSPGLFEGTAQGNNCKLPLSHNLVMDLREVAEQRSLLMFWSLE